MANIKHTILSALVGLSYLLVVNAQNINACPPGDLLLPIPIGPFACRCVDINDVNFFPDSRCTYTVIGGAVPVCVANCPPSPPAPSRRSTPGPNVLRSSAPCPLGAVECPAASNSNLDNMMECVYPDEDLNNCGGCTSTGAGVDCERLEGVKSSSCVQSQCAVLDCNDGYTLSHGPSGAAYCARRNNGRFRI